MNYGFKALYEAELVRVRKVALKYRYGITPEQYDQMCDTQKGLCAICGRPPRRGKRLAVDHNHITNQVRGLLCGSCNMRLGVLEAEDWRRKAEQYLAQQEAVAR